MKKQIIKTTAMIGLFLMLAIVTVQAQTTAGEVNVPFDFVAGKTELKAGTYNIKQRSGNVLAISNAEGKTVALVNAPLTIGSRDAKAGTRLVFNQYDTRHFLSQVWLRVDTGRQLFTTDAETAAAREHKLAKRKGAPKRVDVAINR
jgi:hypothetical protein